MKNKPQILLVIFLSFFLIVPGVMAKKNKVAQSGMTYLAISMGARETAMGDASTASTRGITGMWHNPAVLADIDHLAFSINQVDWLVDTKLYGAAVAYSLGNWGTIGLDLTYMDFGEIIGTQRVDKSIDYRGFITTGDLGIEDYAIGLAYSRRINDKFALGFKVKRLHENLGMARYVSAIENEGTENETKIYSKKEWAINDWGLDFGTIYNVGWKSLAFAMTMQNFSRDMKYWYEEFQTPMVLRMGITMDVTDLWGDGFENIDLNVAIDAMHPNDHTERVHFGSELVFMNRFFLRGGYKFNHEVESATFGIGLNFDFEGVTANLDYAYGTAQYFKDVSRLSLQFMF